MAARRRSSSAVSGGLLLEPKELWLVSASRPRHDSVMIVKGMRGKNGRGRKERNAKRTRRRKKREKKKEKKQSVSGQAPQRFAILVYRLGRRVCKCLPLEVFSPSSESYSTRSSDISLSDRRDIVEGGERRSEGSRYSFCCWRCEWDGHER